MLRAGCGAEGGDRRPRHGLWSMRGLGAGSSRAVHRPGPVRRGSDCQEARAVVSVLAGSKSGPRVKWSKCGWRMKWSQSGPSGPRVGSLGSNGLGLSRACAGLRTALRGGLDGGAAGVVWERGGGGVLPPLVVQERPQLLPHTRPPLRHQDPHPRRGGALSEPHDPREPLHRVAGPAYPTRAPPHLYRSSLRRDTRPRRRRGAAADAQVRPRPILELGHGPQLTPRVSPRAGQEA